jgi:dTDP-glucose 4,6-dehydratase
MRILVTGGAGFIGSAVTRQMVAAGRHEILNVDKLTYAANPDNLKEVSSLPNYRFERIDICDAPAIRQAIADFDPDCFIHLAAETHVDRSIDGPGSFITTNVVGTSVLLQAATDHWLGLTPARAKAFRFVHVSTDEVFGSLGPTGHFSETTPYAPNSPYSASKASSDMLVRAWHRTYGLPALVSNCSNNYGPYQFPEKLIPVVILAALEGRPIPVYGKGTNVRDWLYVEDHVSALVAILERGRPGETYAVGGGAELTNLELVRLVCSLMDELIPESPHRPHEQLITFVADRPGHDLRYAIDASKAERELGWRPAMSVAEGMRRTVRWYLENRWWWEAIRARGFKDDRLGLGAPAQAAAD